MRTQLFLFLTALFFSTLQAEMNDLERTKQEIAEQVLESWKSNSQTQPVIVLIGGFPGSGKSKLAKVIHQSYESEIISFDAIRQALIDRGEFIGGGESFNIIQDIYQNLFKIAFAARINLIVDTNAHSERILEIEQLLKQESADQLYRRFKICLNPPFETLLERVRSREQVPGVHQGTEANLRQSFASKTINLEDYDIVIDTGEIAFAEEWQIVNEALQKLSEEQSKKLLSHLENHVYLFVKDIIAYVVFQSVNLKAKINDGNDCKTIKNLLMIWR